MAAATLTLLGCGGGGPYSTPEATFETFQTAQAESDWKRVCECLTPDSRDVLAGSLVFLGAGSKFVSTAAQFDSDAVAEKVGSGVLGRMKNMARHTDEVFQKHGISGDVLGDAGVGMQVAPGPDEYRKLAAELEDRDEFVADMLAALRNVTPNAVDDMTTATLGIVDTNGETATAETTSKQHPQLRFKLIDGEWKLDYDLSEQVSRAASLH